MKLVGTMNIDVIENCFPSYLKDDVNIVFRTLDFRSKHEPYMPFEVQIDQEKLVIPQRIYCDEHQLKKLIKLTPIQQAIGFCFFSRHHDGYVRERCIRQVFNVNEKFVIPFIVQLLGEYVIEIIESIYQAKDNIDKSHLQSFIEEILSIITAYTKGYTAIGIAFIVMHTLNIERI